MDTVKNEILLTADQAWTLFREELLDGFDSGELNEEELATQLKALRQIVKTFDFKVRAFMKEDEQQKLQEALRTHPPLEGIDDL